MFSFDDRYVRSYQSFKATRIFDHEHESTKILQDDGKCLSVRHGITSQKASIFSNTDVKR